MFDKTETQQETQVILVFGLNLLSTNEHRVGMSHVARVLGSEDANHVLHTTSLLILKTSDTDDLKIAL